MKEVIETNEQYHSSDAISASGLKFIAKKSVHHFLNKQFQESPAMKFGTAVHSGFGLGFERLVQFATGMGNIRDVIPFPRTPQNAEF